jgi:transposase-like protein
MAQRFSKERVQEFIERRHIKSVEDIQSALKDLFGQTLQAMLEGEMDHHLGYAKGEAQSKQTHNRRNGHSSKSLRSDYGDIALTVPRDREGDFEPLIVRKRQKNITGIEEQILALYAKGVSCREIQGHLEHLYGIEVWPTFISNVTERCSLRCRSGRAGRWRRCMRCCFWMRSTSRCVTKAGSSPKQRMW